jgi:hypothetical protein
MQDGEPNMYTGLCTLLNGQVQRRWQRVQMLMVFNSIAIPTVFTTTSSLLKLLLCLTRFSLHLVITNAAKRGERWVGFWIRKLEELEKTDQEQSAGEKRSRVSVFTDVEYQRLRAKAVHRTRTTVAYGFALAVVWFAGACLVLVTRL